MESFSLQYKNSEQLKAFVESNIPVHYSDILIQIFSGVIDPDYLTSVSREIHQVLPRAKVIGATTAGEIVNGELMDETVCINFSVFQKTQVSTHFLAAADYDQSCQFAKENLKPNTKALICFTECFSFDPGDLFSAIYDLSPQILISGGAAGDNGAFTKTYIMHDTEVHEEGIVLCALHSDELKIATNMALNWISIGRQMEITKSEGNVVYEINNQPVLDVYKYYLGGNITLDRPYEFPLIKVDNGVEIGRSCIGINPDNSFVYAGRLDHGDMVRFSVGNADEAEHHAVELQAEVNMQASEAIFTYSCFGRKTFFGENIAKEFLYLQQIAPTTGFFSFGEFYSTGLSNQVLSNTTTVLSLCEDSTKKPTILDDTAKLEPFQNRMMSLTCLVNVTQRELQDSIELLNYAQDQLIETEKMASLGSLVAGVSHEINTPVGVALTGNSQIGYEIGRLKQLFETNKLSEEALQRFITTCTESSQTVSNSLQNAVNLVNSFKSISVDQHSGEIRKFNFRQYANEIFTSFKSELRTKDVSIKNEIPDDIELESSPGIFAQIFSNLIMNALRHGFDEDADDNHITVYTTYNKHEDQLVFHFSDNGKGVPKENIKSIFDPFFTTARGQGGSGLGLNVVYNLVTQSLSGRLEVIDDEKQGFHLAITLK